MSAAARRSPWRSRRRRRRLSRRASSHPRAQGGRGRCGGRVPGGGSAHGAGGALKQGAPPRRARRAPSPAAAAVRPRRRGRARHESAGGRCLCWPDHRWRRRRRHRRRVRATECSASTMQTGARARAAPRAAVHGSSPSLPPRAFASRRACTAAREGCVQAEPARGGVVCGDLVPAPKARCSIFSATSRGSGGWRELGASEGTTSSTSATAAAGRGGGVVDSGMPGHAMASTVSSSVAAVCVRLLPLALLAAASPSGKLLLLPPAPLLPRCSRLEISAACALGLARSLLEPLG